MTVLIVDDQMTVLKGLLSGVHFSDLGIENVMTATGAIEAREIIDSEAVDIILSDIEMPGENGLVLLKWVAENHPEIIRILLTSHADFTYAQESIKLGCFDYIVQPAPYLEIEQSLRKTIAKYNLNQEKEQYYRDGVFYTNHKTELSDRTVLNLYSRNPANVQQAVNVLNQMGYPLKGQSNIQIMILDIYPLVISTDSTFLDLSIRNQIIESLKICQFTPPVYCLLTLNKYNQFVILLFCNDDTLLNYSNIIFDTFYHDITTHICPEISCYIGIQCLFPELRYEVGKMDIYAKNNVNKKPGLYFIDQNKPVEKYLSISENFSRWKLLLNSGQFDALQDSILSYIEYISVVNRINLKTLCDLHQRLTQLFFIYAYQHEIDVTALFTEEYSYNYYMDGFTNTKALKKSISFIIPAIASHTNGDNQKNDVQLAKDYILNNISQNLSVKNVADYVHLSPEYFTKIFKKEVGQNIKNYILQVKVNVAKDLLGNPNIPISMVALDLGYSNFSHFTQMFKKFEDVTPTEYRKNLLD